MGKRTHNDSHCFLGEPGRLDWSRPLNLCDQLNAACVFLQQSTFLVTIKSFPFPVQGVNAWKGYFSK